MVRLGSDRIVSRVSTYWFLFISVCFLDVNLIILKQPYTLNIILFFIKQMQTNKTKFSDFSLQDNQLFMYSSTLEQGKNKDETIQILQEKNERLRGEVNKVDKMLQKQPSRIRYGNKIPEVRNEVIDRQLDNAYKLINFYDYQVKKLKNMEKEGSFAEQIFKVQKVLKQREEMVQKLRRQLGYVKKQSMGVVKQLKNDSKKQQNAERKYQVQKEIKWLRDKLRQAKLKKDIINHNAEQQTTLIKKYEKQLSQHSFSNGALQQMKSKYTTSPVKDSKGEKNDDINEKGQDRNPEAYVQNLAQIKLLQKLQKSHAEQIEYLKKELQEAFLVNLTSRNKVLQIEDQIEKVQNRIEELKPKIDPRNLKPHRTLSMEEGFTTFGKSNRNKSILIPLKPPKPAFPHLFKFEEVGSLSKNGRRFSDRVTVAKNPSKIIGVDFYTDNETGFLIGLQATYLVKQVAKKSNLNLIIEKKKATKVPAYVANPQFDYYRNIQCYSDERKIVVGISMTSHRGESISVGNVDGSRRPLSISRDECAGCFFGSFSELGLQLFGVQIVELED